MRSASPRKVKEATTVNLTDRRLERWERVEKWMRTNLAAYCI
jgi:hypothetical protein